MIHRQALVRMYLVMMWTSPSFIVLIVHYYRNQALPKATTSGIDEKDLYLKKLSRRAENADCAKT